MNDSPPTYCPLCKDKYLRRTIDNIHLCSKIVMYDAGHPALKTRAHHYVNSLSIICINEPPFVFTYLKQTKLIEVWSHSNRLLQISGAESDLLPMYYRFSKLKAFL
jgi:hypothetical protein